MKKKQIKQLTIKEDKWGRGTGFGSLLNEDGNMCCLGFLGKACGIPKIIMLDKEMPYDLNKRLQKLYPDVSYDTYETPSSYDELAEINDNDNISDMERKKILTQKFKEYFNIKLLFT